MKGWKTVAFGLLVMIGPAALDYLGAVKWQDLGLSPGMSALVGAGILALRAVTTTPIGKAAGFLVMPGLGLGLAGVLAACTSAQVDTARSYQEKIAAACAIAAPLAGAAPSVGIYVTAACASEQTIAKLALDPSSLAWMQGLIAQLQGKAK